MSHQSSEIIQLFQLKDGAAESEGTWRREEGGRKCRVMQLSIVGVGVCVGAVLQI